MGFFFNKEWIVRDISFFFMAVYGSAFSYRGSTLSWKSVTYVYTDCHGKKILSNLLSYNM